MNLPSVATLSTKRYGAKAFTSDEDEDFEEMNWRMTTMKTTMRKWT